MTTPPPELAAKAGDVVIGTDTHIIMIPSPTGPVPTPVPMPFQGVVDGELASDVVCEGMPLAVDGSTASNTPPHIPAGGPFQKPPSNRATIVAASTKVVCEGKPVARSRDIAMTCNDPVDAPNGTVVAKGTVFVG